MISVCLIVQNCTVKVWVELYWFMICFLVTFHNNDNELWGFCKISLPADICPNETLFHVIGCSY
jgi:hypothetical protein